MPFNRVAAMGDGFVDFAQLPIGVPQVAECPRVIGLEQNRLLKRGGGRFELALFLQHDAQCIQPFGIARLPF